MKYTTAISALSLALASHVTADATATATATTGTNMTDTILAQMKDLTALVIPLTKCGITNEKAEECSKSICKADDLVCSCKNASKLVNQCLVVNDDQLKCPKEEFKQAQSDYKDKFIGVCKAANMAVENAPSDASSAGPVLGLAAGLTAFVSLFA